MQETEFWTQLRFLINGADRPWSCRDRLGYCDWFEVRCYRLGSDRPRIDGRVGFLKEPKPETCNFYLTLPPDSGELAEIDWSRLLPRAANQLEIEFDSVQGRILLTILPQATCDP